MGTALRPRKKPIEPRTCSLAKTDHVDTTRVLSQDLGLRWAGNVEKKPSLQRTPVDDLAKH